MTPSPADQTPVSGSLTDDELRAEAVPVAVVGADPAVNTSSTAPHLPVPESATAADVLQQATSVQDYVILRFAVVGLTVIALVCIIGSLFLLFRIISREGDVATAAAAMAGVMGLAGVAVGGLVTMLTRVPLYPMIKPASSSDRRQG